MIKIGLFYVFLAVVYFCGNSLRNWWCQPVHARPAAFDILAIYSAKKDHLVDIIGSGSGEVIGYSFLRPE